MLRSLRAFSGLALLVYILSGCTQATGPKSADLEKENEICKVKKVEKTVATRPGELLYFDFERKENGAFPNVSNQLYYGKITGEPELVAGKSGCGLLFSKPGQSVKVNGLRKLPFASFECEFDIKPLKPDSQGYLLYGPNSILHREGFGIRLEKDARLNLIYSTKSNPNNMLVASEKLPLEAFTRVKIIYNDQVPSLVISQNRKIVAKKDLKNPILFNSRGTGTMMLGAGFNRSPLNVVLDEFKFVATSKPKPAVKKATAKAGKKDLDIFIRDKKEFKGGDLSVKFKPARQYGIPEKKLFYRTNRPAEAGEPLKPLMLSMELGFTGKPYNRFLEGEEKKVVLVLRNETAKERKITLKTTVDDWRDKQVWKRENTLILPPKGKSEVIIDLETSQNGCFFINFSCLEDGRKISEYNTAYAVTVDSTGAVKDSKNSPFGQHYHDGFGNTQRFQEVSSDWIRYYRYEGGWDDIELAPGKYDWQYTDKVLDYMIDKRGLNVFYTLIYTPPFYSSMPPERVKATDKRYRAKHQSFYPPKNLEPWKKWLRAIVRRHKGRVKAWEIWNEVNVAGYFEGSVEQYFELLKSGYETIKAEDPEAIVAGGALTGNFMGFAKELFKLGAHKYMDVLTVHYYLQKAPEKEILLASFRQLREVIAKTGKDLPIWDGESSYCLPLRDKNCRIKPVPYGIEKLIFWQSGKLNKTNKTPGERRAAAYSVRQRVLELSLGIKRFFTFNTYAMPDGTYTLNLVAREAMVKNLGDRKFQRNIDLGASHLWGRLFGDADCTAVLWSTCGEQDIILDCNAEKVVISDFLGNTREAAGKNCKITLSDYPVYVLSCGPKISVGSQLFILKPHAERAVIGDDFTVTISNRQSRPVNMGLSILDFKGQKVASADSISLAGGTSKTLTLPVATKATAGSGEIAIFASDASRTKTRHSFPVKLALAPILIPQTNLTLQSPLPADLKPQIRLEKEDQVKVGLRDQAIAEAAPHWRGVEDVSAQAILTWNPKGLYLSVNVTDDQFLSDPAQNPFSNDSIELFLDLRNPPGDGNYDSGVFHYAMRLLPDGKTKAEDYAPGAGTKLNINAKWEKNSKGYRFTAFIPIPAKFNLKPGREIGFDLAVNDADPKRNNNKRVSQLIWRGAADNYRNASLFGVLKLE